MAIIALMLNECLYAGHPIIKAPYKTQYCYNDIWHVVAYNNHFIKVYKANNPLNPQLLILVLRHTSMINTIDLMDDQLTICGTSFSQENVLHSFICYFLERLLLEKKSAICALCNKKINEKFNIAYYINHLNESCPLNYVHLDCCQQSSNSHDIFAACPLCFPRINFSSLTTIDSTA